MLHILREMLYLVAPCLPIIAKVLVALGQLVAHYLREMLPEVESQCLPGTVAVGTDVDVGERLHRLEHCHVLRLQQCGARDGYRLMACREHCPAVACAFGDEERFAVGQRPQHGKIVYPAIVSSWELESGFVFIPP